MILSELFSSLNEISFVNRLPEEIERDIIATYERESKRTLARGDPTRLLLETLAFILILLRNEIDQAGKQNLLAYAQDNFLDHLGALLSVFRLETTSASTTIMFKLATVHSQNSLIPQGTRITPDGDLFFSTTEDLIIPSGELSGIVNSQCQTAGEIGNGFLPGQINKLVDIFPYEVSAENITTSIGGANVESDENFRERIQIAPESLSVAGPTDAYKYHALGSHNNIVDVAILGPAEDKNIEPGNVFIYPLLKGGELPDDEILQVVYETCNADKIRPDTDYLHVLSPEVVEFNLDVKFFIDRANASQATQIREAINFSIEEWITWQKSKLGRDINPSELIRRVMMAGAKRVEIISPVFKIIKPWQVAICQNVSVNFQGLEDE